jgi:putative DNA primase/helicase
MLGWAEGIETAMAATQLTGIPCWATLGTERFARAVLPASVGRLILFLDNGSGGRRAERLAREAHRGTSVEIEARYPKAAGADWNDVLLRLAPL